MHTNTGAHTPLLWAGLSSAPSCQLVAAVACVAMTSHRSILFPVQWESTGTEREKKKSETRLWKVGGEEKERRRKREGRVKPHRYFKEGGATQAGTHKQPLQE